MNKSSLFLSAVSAVLGHHGIESLTKQIRMTITRPRYDAASGRRLLAGLFSGERDTALLMRSLTTRRR